MRPVLLQAWVQLTWGSVTEQNIHETKCFCLVGGNTRSQFCTRPGIWQVLSIYLVGWITRLLNIHTKEVGKVEKSWKCDITLRFQSFLLEKAEKWGSVTGRGRVQSSKDVTWNWFSSLMVNVRQYSKQKVLLV